MCTPEPRRTLITSCTWQRYSHHCSWEFQHAGRGCAGEGSVYLAFVWGKLKGENKARRLVKWRPSKSFMPNASVSVPHAIGFFHWQTRSCSIWELILESGQLHLIFHLSLVLPWEANSNMNGLATLVSEGSKHTHQVRSESLGRPVCQEDFSEPHPGTKKKQRLLTLVSLEHSECVSVVGVMLV